jgi:4'-phosphopantetheinyl transferase
MNNRILYLDIKHLQNLPGPLFASIRAERLKKAQSYHFEADRLRSLAGTLLMERVLNGKEPDFTEYGKPFMKSGPFFNLSHSGDFACLAVSGVSPVGIDIEQHKKRNVDDKLIGLAKSAFHPAELAFFLKNPGAARFYDLWTLKESYIKMLGSGFALPSKEFSVIPDSSFDTLPCRFSCPQKNRFSPIEKTCFFQTFSLFEGYSLSVCSEKDCEFTFEDVALLQF